MNEKLIIYSLIILGLLISVIVCLDYLYRLAIIKTFKPQRSKLELEEQFILKELRDRNIHIINEIPKFWENSNKEIKYCYYFCQKCNRLSKKNRNFKRKNSK
ncbi:hypothetical protein NRK67_12040 [Fusobacteria bacterium ZRK30]|nr:hypothetical protein NRK67_12040 [Fusobacteria bacterium ZRK30]